MLFTPVKEPGRIEDLPGVYTKANPHRPTAEPTPPLFVWEKSIMVDTNRIISFGHGISEEKLPFSDPEGKDGKVKQLGALNRQLREFGTVTASNFDAMIDTLIGRQQTPTMRYIVRWGVRSVNGRSLRNSRRS